MILDKKLMLLGFGVTGQDVLKTLLQKNANVCVVDDNINEATAKYLINENVKFYKTQEAVDQGVKFDYIIKSPGIKYTNPLIKGIDETKIINDIEISYYLTENTNTKIIAITGTNGKTSTTAFVTELLKTAGYNAFSCGNIGISPIRVLTENENVDYLVMELSSFQLKAIDNFKADYAFFLNFSPDHLDYHDDLADYYDSKLKVVKNVPTSKILFAGEAIKKDLIGIDVRMPIKHVPARLTADLKGLSRTNMNLIYQLSKELNIADETFMKALNENYHGLEHRCEYVGEKNGIKFYNDSKATNVESTRIALEQLDNVILLVGGSDKGEDLTCLNKYAQSVKQTIAYGANQDNFTMKPMDKVNDLEAALTKALKYAQSGDVVLLSPSSASYDQYKNYEERGHHFKTLVKNYLGE